MWPTAGLPATRAAETAMAIPNTYKSWFHFSVRQQGLNSSHLSISPSSLLSGLTDLQSTAYRGQLLLCWVLNLWNMYCLVQEHLLLSLAAPVIKETIGKSFCLSHIQHKVHWHHAKCWPATRKEATSLEAALTPHLIRTQLPGSHYWQI